MSKNYLVKLYIEESFDAESEEEAKEKFWEQVNGLKNKSLDVFIDESLDVSELCPHCDVPLKSKMIDVDGTNLEEHKVCPKCGYGTPALK